MLSFYSLSTFLLFTMSALVTGKADLRNECLTPLIVNTLEKSLTSFGAPSEDE